MTLHGRDHAMRKVQHDHATAPAFGVPVRTLRPCPSPGRIKQNHPAGASCPASPDPFPVTWSPPVHLHDIRYVPLPMLQAVDRRPPCDTRLRRPGTRNTTLSTPRTKRTSSRETFYVSTKAEGAKRTSRLWAEAVPPSRQASTLVNMMWLRCMPWAFPPPL